MQTKRHYRWQFRQKYLFSYLSMMLVFIIFGVTGGYRYMVYVIHNQYSWGNLLFGILFITLMLAIAYGAYHIGLRSWIASFRQPEFIEVNHHGIIYCRATQQEKIAWDEILKITLTRKYLSHRGTIGKDIGTMRIIKKNSKIIDINIAEMNGDHIDVNLILIIPAFIIFIMFVSKIYAVIAFITINLILSVPVGRKSAKEIQQALRHYGKEALLVSNGLL
ncbi:hypothetical protein [Cardiobacterium valvarum]|uniref:Uncharacterized protein n=1 Tax=Cardiobacterium valvarum TaxID=194702 RepID=A0A381EBJ7_9GAMM|nr:hypothetical protein [Cardiobacterium valvarum]SUX24253.1 Uncharacterised protein [Cardiobacterium valvarum]